MSSETKDDEKGTVMVVMNSPAEIIKQGVSKGANLVELKAALELEILWQENEARKAYHVAMAEFKKNPPKIDKDKKVGYETSKGAVGYSHSSLGNVTEKINQALSAHDLSASWRTSQEAGNIKVTCKITHAKGHSEETSLVAMADNTGSKNSIQAMGSTITYLERYTILALTGLATFDMDDDGNNSQEIEYIDDKEKSILLDLITDKGVPMEKFLKALKIEEVSQLLKKDYPKAKLALEAKVKK